MPVAAELVLMPGTNPVVVANLTYLYK